MNPFGRPAAVLFGLRFGRLVVVERNGSKNGSPLWLCQCDCGKKTLVRSRDLKTGRTKSCGCLRDDKLRSVAKKHGHTIGGRSRIYRIWENMKQRCMDVNSTNYERYGGRGIYVCDHWRNSFESFYEDMGDPPSSKHSIDRADNNGPYESANCRWATAKEQRANRRDSAITR